MDIVTTDIEINVDFYQLTLIHEISESFEYFFKSLRQKQDRSSRIDRENVVPSIVSLSSSSILPSLPSDMYRRLAFPLTKQNDQENGFGICGNMLPSVSFTIVLLRAIKENDDLKEVFYRINILVRQKFTPDMYICTYDHSV
jgi:hypothetical protein